MTGGDALGAKQTGAKVSDADLVQRFAQLHQGGAIADLIGGQVRPRKDGAGEPSGHKGAAWYVNVEAHLFGDEPLGVYPVLRDSNELWFGAIDWDIGDEDSLVHAYNVEQALAYLDINSFVEMSRSKGVHLWVYVEEPVPAELMRNALTSICDVVGAPTTEVFPKQVSLEGKTFGNCIRLPYPKIRSTGRQGVRKGSWSLKLEDFVEAAYDSRTTSEHLTKVALLAKPKPKPAPLRQERLGNRREYPVWLDDLLKYGPSRTREAVDRSGALWTIAVGLAFAGHDASEMRSVLIDWDSQWGQKYTNRSDGDLQYDTLVSKALTHAEVEQQKFKLKFRGTTHGS